MNIFIFPKVDFGSLLFHQGFATECFRLKLSVDGKPRTAGSSVDPCLCCFKNMVSWFEIVIVNIVLNRYLFIRLCRAIFFQLQAVFGQKPILSSRLPSKKSLTEYVSKDIGKNMGFTSLERNPQKKNKINCIFEIAFRKSELFPGTSLYILEQIILFWPYLYKMNNSSTLQK